MWGALPACSAWIRPSLCWANRVSRYRWLLRLVGVALFLLILRAVDVSRIVQYLSGAQPLAVVLSIVLFVPHILTKAWRWQILLRQVGISLSIGEAWRLYALGLAAGTLTPGQAGEAVKAVYLRGAGHSLGRSLVTILVDRLFDLFVVGGLALWGVFALGQAPAGQIVTIVLFVAAVAVMFILLTTRGWQAPLARLARRLLPARLLAGRNLERMLSDLVLPPSTLGAALAITLLSFVVTYFRLWLFFVALHINVPFGGFLASTSMAGIAAVLPVTVAGVGTRDAAFIGAFRVLGVPNYEVAAVALSSLILLHLLTNWVVGFAAWAWKPLGNEQLKGQ